MNKRVFGKTGIAVSEVGLGTWQLGADWGEVDDKEALRILHHAAEAGVNFFDTADVYGQGRSETLVAKFLKESPRDAFIATKIGRRSDPGWPANFKLETMRQHVEDCLRRLDIEALDLVQLHCIPTQLLKDGQVFENLRVLIKEGKIKHYGVSVESMEEANICLAQDDVTSLQIIFNIFRQKPITALFEQTKAKNVALIARVPLASGLLSGKMSKATHFKSADHRNYNRDGQAFNVGETFAGLPFERGVELAEEIKPLVPENMTMPQMALRWILDHEAITTVIPGASKVSQVESNVSASDLPPLSSELRQKLSALYSSSIEPYIRGPY